MRYVILGTAGHIDHGKSALVKALTGIDPDRLKEEKERGITIDLGFADLVYPDGPTIGIVDVPGHERLVKNMLAGAGAIDMVMLVIAADEGVMPQTREHLHICDLLKIRSGLIAVTKSDLVEPDWLELVQEEARDFVQGTFLKDAAIIPLSSKTGHNLELLKEKIRDTALAAKPKSSAGIFRMPVDRVFTLKGFGTVVTGTTLSGSVSVEDAVEIQPGGLTGKVRGLHSHGKQIDTAGAGRRVAVNLQGIDKDELGRGDNLVSVGRFSPTRILTAKLEILKHAPPVKNRSLLHFHLGSSETVARVVLYGAGQVAGGGSCYCRLRLEGPVLARSGDRYVVRRFSPVETVGGGMVLDPSPLPRTRGGAADELETFETGTLEQKIALKVRHSGLKGISRAKLEGWIAEDVADVGAAVAALLKAAELIEFENVLVHSGPFQLFQEQVVAMLEAFHKKNPLKQGMSKEEIRTSLRAEPRTFAKMLSSLKQVAVEKEMVRLSSFTIVLSEGDRKKIVMSLKDKGFHPPSRAELAAALSLDEKRVADMLKLMQKDGSVVKITDSLYLSQEDHGKMLGKLKGFFQEKPEMSVSEFRDLLGTSRKFAVPLLEHLDSTKVTLRVGDVRKFLLKELN